MKIKVILLLILASSIFIAGCCGQGEKDNKAKASQTVANMTSLNNATKQELSAKGKAIAQQTVSVLQKHLKQAIKTGGIDNAIDYCHKKAMFLTDSISQVNKVKIRRVAEKNRNPFNTLNEQQKKLFEDYQQKTNSHQQIKPTILTDDEGHPIFYAPIKITKDVCLKCHGKPGTQISEKTMSKIKRYYPNDKAINFNKGSLRGMWAITFTEYKVK
jgi:PBP1b-binding outer membrane lipoprotein LpoB